MSAGAPLPLPANPDEWGIAPDGGYICISDGATTVSGNGDPTSIHGAGISHSGAPRRFGFSSDGRYMPVMDKAHSSVQVLDIRDNGVPGDVAGSPFDSLSSPIGILPVTPPQD